MSLAAAPVAHHNTMALSHAGVLLFSEILWIVLILSDGSYGKRTQKYFMDGADCGNTKYIGGATVLSHQNTGRRHSKYKHGTDCQIMFKAENTGWKIKLDVITLDIPDIEYNTVCGDALYVYDSDKVLKRPIIAAGGNNGLCGKRRPETIYSTGQYLTLYFSTNKKQPRGRGFKLILTAFSNDYKKYKSCGGNFVCNSSRLCIDEDLRCDDIIHCSDRSDESPLAGCPVAPKTMGKGKNTHKTNENKEESSNTDSPDEDFFQKILSLGIAAAVAIFVGTAIVVCGCFVAIVCCCRRRRQAGRSERDLTSKSVTTQNTVTKAGSQPYGTATETRPCSNHDYGPHGYIAMQPQPIYSHQMGMMYQTPYGQPVNVHHNSQDSTSGISSQPYSQPNNHQRAPVRSTTPTSSRSSNRTHSDITCRSNDEKVALPVNL